MYETTDLWEAAALVASGAEMPTVRFNPSWVFSFDKEHEVLAEEHQSGSLEVSSLSLRRAYRDLRVLVSTEEKRQ